MPKEQIRIHRYPNFERVFTRLDPFEDLLTWVHALKSNDYTCDLLKQIHNVPNHKIKRASSSITSHVTRVVEFIDQAYSGPKEISYLPIYYALLNLAKVMIITGGRINDLEQQRRHGANWSGIDRNVTDLKNDEIRLWGQGTIPLLYQVLTGSMWPKTRRKNKNGRWINTLDRRIKLSEIYPYISSIAFEYSHIYGLTEALSNIIVYFEQPNQDISRIVVTFAGNKPTSSDRRRYKILKGFNEENDLYSLSEKTSNLGSKPFESLRNQLRLFLLYDTRSNVNLQVQVNKFKGNSFSEFTATYTPICGSNLLLPEEFPILLAFFHLSNVVRYKPNRLLKLFDSKASIILESLIKQGTFRFLELFWSFMNNKTYIISK
jgi:hypothetical protein